MASTDAELIAEVRSLTSYGPEVVSELDMQMLVAVAKEEILDLVDEASLNWYTDRSSERALFWLVALFTKIHTGEVGGASFTLEALEQSDTDVATGFWMNQFFRHLTSIGLTGVFGIRSIGRDDRTYDDTTQTRETDELL